MANPQFLPEIFSAAAENLPYASQDRKAHCKFASCPENILKKPCRWGQTVSLLWHVWTADQATWTSCSSDRRGGEEEGEGAEEEDLALSGAIGAVLSAAARTAEPIAIAYRRWARSRS